MLPFLGVVLVGAIAILIVLRMLGLRRVLVFEHQRGLRYDSGRYVATLNPGHYWILSRFSSISVVDIRPEFVTVPGQDLLTAEGASIKVSLAAEYYVADPNVAINKCSNFRAGLYLTLQMAAREIVGKEKIDALVENRAGFSGRLMELTTAKASEYGLKLVSANVKDIMFPGEMKKVFTQVIKAQKEGQAALEKARGETAALRSLANAAKMIEDNPNLLQLRALQTLADSSGNTLVFGLNNGTIPVAKGFGAKPGNGRKEPSTEE
jgi:regulator of protease activity HflC (stomatin/prohibitin superfamily)